MWNLIQFFAKNSPFFTWLLLAIISLVMVFTGNPYQRSVWFSSANVVTGSIYDVSNLLTGYFGLRDINEDLLARTGELEEENIRLRQMLREYAERDSIAVDQTCIYRYSIAHVVNNSITQVENYITIDKGSADGIRQGLGVADQNGILGIVSSVSEHYSLVISLLNPRLRVSAKIRNSMSFGSLVWDGDDIHHVLLEDLPRSVTFEKGDTVVTTSYTSAFPEGIPVGRVVKSYDAKDQNFLTLVVELFPDFNRLQDVHVIANIHQDERAELESMSEGIGGK